MNVFNEDTCTFIMLEYQMIYQDFDRCSIMYIYMYMYVHYTVYCVIYTCTYTL